MRCLLLVALLAACAPSPPAPPPVLPRLDVLALTGPIAVDGAVDDAWAHASELVVPLKGGGTGEVKLKAAHDGKRLYLLAIWNDPSASYARFWRYEGDLKWAKTEHEDGFSVCWCPPDLAEPFRAQACAATCHDGRHAYPGTGSGFVDFWYWGSEQCALFPQARDLWLRQGDGQRLRGDRQPADSDNVPNRSDKYDGPSVFPTRIVKGVDRILPLGPDLKEVTPEWIRQYWKEESNIGREVPLDLLRARKGSRGDVVAAARHHDEPQKIWVLEMARDLDTGNGDDLRLGGAPALFAVAVYDDAGGGDHAVSGAIELRFLPVP